MKIYFDTAVLVAASVADHPNHVQAAGAIHAVHAKKAEAYVSAHGLAELYSVLTRTPFTPPVYPAEAWQVISENILPYFEVVTLSAKEYSDTIRNCAKLGLTGGRLYDALHLRCAQKSGCSRIYTFNVKHFKTLAPEMADLISAPVSL